MRLIKEITFSNNSDFYDVYLFPTGEFASMSKNCKDKMSFIYNYFDYLNISKCFL
ncbi:hypothetical protein GLIP_1314 [Aliiglaciecola lipolytica E3]|uniref:Uncharacterized protein n=1 Tax=Aliiglaciecola lipolytica E3 TaxID=1127673 RepID=K6YRK6_9ALTE|nr:hypothetical protein GLIP_1314 [Aliiglaciecola lipolytica E3]